MRTMWISAAGLLWLATTAPAQVVPAFEDLPLRLNLGDTVVVDARAGGSTEGRLVRLSPDEIAITGPGDRERVFARSDIGRVQKRGDSLGNGMKLGAIIGGAVGCAFAGTFSGEFRGGDCLAGILTFGGVGLGLGLLFDVMHVGATTVFSASAEGASWRQPGDRVAVRATWIW